MPLLRVVRYTREEGDTAPIDEAEVNEMLFQRSQHRQDRNFDEADAIQRQLSSMGVTVYDRERKWFVGYGGRGGGGQMDGGRGRGRGRGGFQDGYQRRVGQRTLEYTREAGDRYAVDVAAVVALIEERSAMRLSRDFAGADRLRDELKAVHGVYLQDKDLKWYVGSGERARDRDLYERSDDRYERGNGPAYERGSASGYERSRAGRGYERKPYETQREDGRGVLYDRTSSSVERRQMGKRERQAATRAAKAEPYVRSPADSSEGLAAAEVGEVQELVDERLQAKLSRDFERADELLATLKARGVTISDDRRLWRADGKRFPTHTYAELGPT